MFYEESEILFQETQKMLKEAKKVSREENKKIDDEWLKKVNTTMNLISSNSNDFRSVSEVVSSAKKERDYLLKQLSLYFNNTEKQTKISKRLVNLNNVIASYENALQEKEERKLEFLKNKKTDIVSSMLEELIKNVDKEIKKISSKVDSKMEELRSLSGQADFKKVTKELNILNEKLINFSNLNNSLNSLKTYNGNVISDKKLTELTANLTKEDKKLVTACYNLIISNRINLRKLSPSPKRVVPNNDKKLDEEIKAVEKVEKSIAANNFNPAEFVDAYNKVNALKDGKEKEELLKRLDAITNKLADCLNDHLKDLEKIDIKTIVDVDKIESGKINSVVRLFDFLVKYARNFDKISFGQRVEAAVNKFNMQQQNTYKLTKEEGPVKQFGFWAKMRQLKPFVTARKNHRLNIYKEALVKSSNKQEKQAAIEGIKQIDIVNGVRLFMARNKLNKLKCKLHTNGVSGLNDEEKVIYDKSANTISARILNELEKSMEETAEDKIRVKTVIGQLLEVLSICPEVVEVTNIFGKVKKVYNKTDIFNNSFKYIRSAFKNGSLNEQEYKAYLDEINNIALYRNSVDDYYEVPSVYDDGNEIYSELDNETKKYYEEPVKYADKNNIETDISYVRK